jgi:hypothetical protein
VYIEPSTQRTAVDNGFVKTEHIWHVKGDVALGVTGGIAPTLSDLGGEWSASRPGRALPPGKEPPVPTAGWAGGPQSRSGRRG